MNKLTQILAQDDTILFIGSGISLWSGLPTWGGLIENLAQFIESIPSGNAKLIREEAKAGELLQAASYGFSKLSTYQIGEFIKESCKYYTAIPASIHQKIIELGPSCFITTNYDNLLEQSIRKWRPNSNFQAPITNRQLIATADIIQASARDFVFKLHGDASDSESIILTQEQYGQLLPGGKLNGALKAVEILLASRPVVYIGFGLRDPDFIYLRHLLRNTYEGGVRDHYAIMANINEEQIDYWRKEYGIHLVGYKTKRRDDGTSDHSELLLLLEDLTQKDSIAIDSSSLTGKEQSDNHGFSAESLLAIARYAGKLMRATKANPELPIRVYANQKIISSQPISQHNRFNGLIAESFLVSGPKKAILLGAPGAGKSYAIKRATATLADILYKYCLDEQTETENLKAPFIIDLKQYNGDLWSMLEGALPSSLSAKKILADMQVKIFLDSFNEMPREYRENGHYESDFLSFINRIGNAELIIGSRSNDGLTNLGLDIYDLQQIDIRYIEGEVAKGKLIIHGRFEKEIKSLLQKPLYFQLVISGIAKLSINPHPKDLYSSLFKSITTKFNAQYQVDFDLERSLSLPAFNAINRGEEAQSINYILEAINKQIIANDIEHITANDVANWLVSENILIPYSGGLISFFHQSVTEYLAAFELAQQYKKQTDILKDLVRLKRWDQALFLTISLLPSELASSFLETIIEIDFELAMNSVKYLEFGTEEIISRLLIELPDKVKLHHIFNRSHDKALQNDLPLSTIHIPLLEKIVATGDVLGTAALERLNILGVVDKEKLFDLLYEHRLDQNFARNGVAKFLKPLISIQDIIRMRRLADQIPERNANPHYVGSPGGFVVAVADILTKFELSIIKDIFIENKQVNELPIIVRSIIESILLHHKTTEALELAAEFLESGELRAANNIVSLSYDDKLS